MTHMTRMTHCDSSVPTVGHSFFEALLPLVIISTSPSSLHYTQTGRCSKGKVPNWKSSNEKDSNVQSSNLIDFKIM